MLGKLWSVEHSEAHYIEYDDPENPKNALEQLRGFKKYPLPWNRKNRQRLFVMMGLSNLIQSIGYSMRENYKNDY